MASPVKSTEKKPSRKATAPTKKVSAFKLPTRLPGKVEVLSSKVAYQGPLFSVHSDQVCEPGGSVERRDVIHHQGSVVILAVDESNPKDPIVILERQYRHAAGMYLWEIPAGRKEVDETPLAAARRELIEETGYRATRWTKLARYFASPGFLGEWMQVYLAQGITPGIAQPEADEFIELQRVPLSCLLRMIEAGEIHDGKTIIAVMLYQAGRRSKRF